MMDKSIFFTLFNLFKVQYYRDFSDNGFKYKSISIARCNSWGITTSKWLNLRIKHKGFVFKRY